MIYLAANNSGVWKLRASGFPIGMMMSPDGLRRPVRGESTIPYALDNGLFRLFGQPEAPQQDRLRIVGVLSRIVCENWPLPLFAVVPDVPYDGARSWKVSHYWRGVLRELFPAIPLALAVQDGMVAADLDGYDWAFVAGSDEWKDRTIPYWADACRSRGMRCHVARVNETRRLRAAINAGVDSSDGTGIWRGDKAQKGRVLSGLIQGEMFVAVTRSGPAAGAADERAETHTGTVGMVLPYRRRRQIDPVAR